MTRWFGIAALLAALLLASLAVSRTADAQSVGCSSIGLLSTQVQASSRSITAGFDAGDVISVSAYYVVDPNVGYPLVLDVTGASSQTGNPVSYTIPTTGNYTVTVTSNFDALQQLTATCTPAPPTATPSNTATFTNTPTFTMTPTYTPTYTPSPRPTATPWPGTTDGRLGADPAEAYSLWCSGNNLNVWSAASGRGVQLAAIPLAALIGQPVGVPVLYPGTTGPLTVLRAGADAFLVQGNTGNNAPAFGIKPFSLAQCITANGGAPVVPPTRTPTRPASSTPLPSKTPLPSSTPSATATRAPTATLDPSEDTDGDGVRNSLDVCKDVPGTVYGCPDPDGDGAAGPLDLCPEAAGPLSLRGCPDADTDLDGVPDSQDLCPREAPTAGQTSVDGCTDQDGDGVPDSVTIQGTIFVIDWCANQIVRPVPQVQGCNDPDNDGMVTGPFVPDARKDSCPTEAGLPDLRGCPPAGNIIIPTFSPTQALFAYANQTGAYANLTVGGYVPQSESCVRSSWGFCLNIVSPTATPRP